MRVTKKLLKAIVDNINELTDSPKEPYTKTINGYKPNPGNFHLSGAYGGWALHRMDKNGGSGVDDIFSGHYPKRELAEKMWAFIKGLEFKKKGTKK